MVKDDCSLEYVIPDFRNTPPSKFNAKRKPAVNDFSMRLFQLVSVSESPSISVSCWKSRSGEKKASTDPCRPQEVGEISIAAVESITLFEEGVVRDDFFNGVA